MFVVCSIYLNMHHNEVDTFSTNNVIFSLLLPEKFPLMDAGKRAGYTQLIPETLYSYTAKRRDEP